MISNIILPKSLFDIVLHKKIQIGGHDKLTSKNIK